MQKTQWKKPNFFYNKNVEDHVNQSYSESPEDRPKQCDGLDKLTNKTKASQQNLQNGENVVI